MADLLLVNFINLTLNNGAFSKSKGLIKLLKISSKLLKSALSSVSKLNCTFSSIFCTTVFSSITKYVRSDSCLSIILLKHFSNLSISRTPSTIIAPGILYKTELFLKSYCYNTFLFEQKKVYNNLQEQHVLKQEHLIYSYFH